MVQPEPQPVRLALLVVLGTTLAPPAFAVGVVAVGALVEPRVARVARVEYRVVVVVVVVLAPLQVEPVEQVALAA